MQLNGLILDQSRPMVVVGCNRFDFPTGDDLLPYSFISNCKVSNVILLDGNNYALHVPRQYIPMSIDLSLINAVVLPDRLVKIVKSEGLYYYSLNRESGGNYFGDRQTCEHRKANNGKPEVKSASVERSNKIVVDSNFIANLNPTFLQIDIEGNDLELLLNILEKQCFPEVIVYEYHYQVKQNVRLAHEHILRLGYERIAHPTNAEQNLVYVKIQK